MIDQERTSYRQLREIPCRARRKDLRAARGRSVRSQRIAPLVEKLHARLIVLVSERTQKNRFRTYGNELSVMLRELRGTLDRSSGELKWFLRYWMHVLAAAVERIDGARLVCPSPLNPGDMSSPSTWWLEWPERSES